MMRAYRERRSDSHIAPILIADLSSFSFSRESDLRSSPQPLHPWKVRLKRRHRRFRMLLWFFLLSALSCSVIFVSGAPFCGAKVGKEKLTASPARVSKRDSINLGFLNCLPLLSLGCLYFYYLPADSSPCPFGKCFGILQGIFHRTLPSGVLTGPVN